MMVDGDSEERDGDGGCAWAFAIPTHAVEEFFFFLISPVRLEAS